MYYSGTSCFTWLLISNALATGAKDTPVAVALSKTFTEGDFPSAALKHYSTAAHICVYREQMFCRRKPVWICLFGSFSRGFAASALQ